MNNYALRPWHISFFIHFTIGALFLFLIFMKLPTQDYIEVPVEFNVPPEIQNLNKVEDRPKVVLKSVNSTSESHKPTREVFGTSRNSYTDEQGTVAAKKGNTLAKEADTQILLDTDADSLPTPTEEYLVSQMPVVISEVRPLYPKEAKEKQIEGSVALNVLIDETGTVRQVSVLEGPELFRSGALDAMKKFRFKPALVDGKAVAVRIRYLLKFELEF
jgi:TonB family protein